MEGSGSIARGPQKGAVLRWGRQFLDGIPGKPTPVSYKAFTKMRLVSYLFLFLRPSKYKA